MTRKPRMWSSSIRDAHCLWAFSPLRALHKCTNAQLHICTSAQLYNCITEQSHNCTAAQLHISCGFIQNVNNTIAQWDREHQFARVKVFKSSKGPTLLCQLLTCLRHGVNICVDGRLKLFVMRWRFASRLHFLSSSGSCAELTHSG